MEQQHAQPQRGLMFVCKVCGYRSGAVKDFIRHKRTHLPADTGIQAKCQHNLETDLLRSLSPLPSSTGSTTDTEGTVAEASSHLPNVTVLNEETQKPLPPSRIEIELKESSLQQHIPECTEAEITNRVHVAFQPSDLIEKADSDSFDHHNFDNEDEGVSRVLTVTSFSSTPSTAPPPRLPSSVPKASVILKQFSIIMNRLEEDEMYALPLNSVVCEYQDPTDANDNDNEDGFEENRDMQNYTAIDSNTSLTEFLLNDNDYTREENSDFQNCSLCHKVVKSSKMAVHRRLYHPEVNPYKCPECPFEAKSSFYLWRHRSRHRKNCTFSCFHCSDCFETADGLQKHFNMVHTSHYSPPTTKRKIILANAKGKRLNRSTARSKINLLSINPTTSTEEISFQCQYCSKILYNRSSHEEHENQHTRPFHCGMCHLRSGRRSDLRNHMIRVHKLSKDEAWTATTNISITTSHQSSSQPTVIHHSTALVPAKLSRTPPRPRLIPNSKRHKRFRCIKCRKTFHNITSLRLHYAEHNRLRALEGANVHQLTQSAGQGGFRFQCDECPRMCKRVRDLRMHKIVHLLKNEFQCPYCTASFGQMLNKIKHIQKDHGIVWNKNANTLSTAVVQTVKMTDQKEKGQLAQFKNRINLKIHKCESCPYTCRDKQNLVDHAKCHEEQKEFQCSACSASFRRSHSRAFHFRAVHGREWAEKKKSMQVSEKASPAKTRKVEPPTAVENSFYQCDSCPFVTPYSRNYVLHQKCHLEEQEFKCELCSASFSTNQARGRHLTNVHQLGNHKNTNISENDLYESQEANKSVNGNLNRESVELFQCKSCSFATPYQRHLLKHEQCHLEQKAYQCRFCTASFSTSQVTARHMKKIHGFKRERTSGLVFESESGGINYGESKDEDFVAGAFSGEASRSVMEVGLQCTYCEYTSAHAGNMRSHIRNLHLCKRMGNFRCSSCSARFSSQGGLTSHRNSSHKSEFSEEIGRNLDLGYPFVYEQSNGVEPNIGIQRKRHEQKRRLLDGKLGHGQFQDNVSSTNFVNTNKKFPCPTCQEEFVTKEDLHDHAEMECSTFGEMTEGEEEVEEWDSDPSLLIKQESFEEDSTASTITVTQQNSRGLKITSVRFS